METRIPIISVFCKNSTVLTKAVPIVRFRVLLTSKNIIQNAVSDLQILARFKMARIITKKISDDIYTLCWSRKIPFNDQ